MGTFRATASPMSKISDYMTPTPVTVGQEQSLAHAAEVMKQHRIRHLPVLHGGQLVGVLTERDVALLSAQEHVDPHKLTAEDAMSPTTYAVRAETPLREVVAHLAEHRLGSAVIVDQADHVHGIFTTVDAMQMLAEILAERDV